MEKQFFASVCQTKAVDIERGIFEVMISTEGKDRQGDIVRASGGKLDNYLKNPVILWSHNYGDPPVAKALTLETVAGVGIKAQFQFPDWGVSEQADLIHRLWAGGFLNATSIGFMPLKAMPMEPKEPWGSQDFLEWELLEFSIVPVPANADALRLSVKQLAGELEKTGRVLSKTNENKIRSAKAGLEEVLAQLDKQPEEDPSDDGKSVQTNKDDDIEQRNKAEELEAVRAVSTFLDILKEMLK